MSDLLAELLADRHYLLARSLRVLKNSLLPSYLSLVFGDSSWPTLHPGVANLHPTIDRSRCRKHRTESLS